jgi:hypothetical protein
VAAALADEAAVARHLEGAVPTQSAAGSRGWTPLAYLCHARLGRERAEVRQRRARIAAALLAAGRTPSSASTPTRHRAGNSRYSQRRHAIRPASSSSRSPSDQGPCRRAKRSSSLRATIP